MGARVTLATALSGAPEATDLEAFGQRLSEAFRVEVLLPHACVGPSVSAVQSELRDGQVCLIGDLARERAELANDDGFARALAANLDAYVGDAFAALHREHASIARLPRLWHHRALGHAARRELARLRPLLERGERFALVVGGRLFSEKVDLIRALLPRISSLHVGGGVASTLLLARGGAPPDALAEPSRSAQARSLLARARDLGVEVVLPVDRRVLTSDGELRVALAQHGAAGDHPVDVGPQSGEELRRAVGRVERVLWWGPLGDVDAAADGSPGASETEQLLRFAAAGEPRVVIVGDALARFARSSPSARGSGIEWICSGAASARALLTGRRLPGLDALRRAR
jgi:phosphoglycerate kinase